MSHLIAFWSPSHAGASTLLLNVAATLAVRRAPFAAADFNLATPSLALHADALPYPDPRSACLSSLLPALEGDRLTAGDLCDRLLSGPGFPILPGVLDVSLSSRFTEEHVRTMLQALRSRFDLVLADVTPALESVGSLPLLEAADIICVVVTPSLTSRFHTRRSLLPLRGSAISDRMLLLINQAEPTLEKELCDELEVVTAMAVPELRAMPGLLDSGRIAVQAPAIRVAHRRFNRAIEQLTTFLVREVSAPEQH